MLFITLSMSDLSEQHLIRSLVKYVGSSKHLGSFFLTSHEFTFRFFLTSWHCNRKWSGRDDTNVKICPSYRRPESLPACSSTGRKRSCPGTLDLRPGSPGRSCRDPWPRVPRPSGSWWGKLSWWASAQTSSPWTRPILTPAWTDAGSTSSPPSQRTLSTTTWVRKLSARVQGEIWRKVTRIFVDKNL